MLNAKTRELKLEAVLTLVGDRRLPGRFSVPVSVGAPAARHAAVTRTWGVRLIMASGLDVVSPTPASMRAHAFYIW